MPDDFRNHACEEEPEETESEPKIGPVVPIFQDVQGVSFKVHLAIEVHLMERLHGYF